MNLRITIEYGDYNFLSDNLSAWESDLSGVIELTPYGIENDLQLNEVCKMIKMKLKEMQEYKKRQLIGIDNNNGLK